MTNQEAFSTMVLHLRAQGAQALSARPGRVGDCLYRTPEGLKCAVGCLIPDHVYHDGMERRSATDVADEVPCLRDLNVDILEAMRSVHDAIPVTEWEEGFREVAETYGLVCPA